MNSSVKGGKKTDEAFTDEDFVGELWAVCGVVMVFAVFWGGVYSLAVISYHNEENEPVEVWCYNTTQVEEMAALNNIPIFKVAKTGSSAVHIGAKGLLSSAEIQQDSGVDLIVASDPESFISIAKQINATEIYYAEGDYGRGAYKTYAAYQGDNKRVLLENTYPSPYVYSRYTLKIDDANDSIIFRKR